MTSILDQHRNPRRPEPRKPRGIPLPRCKRCGRECPTAISDYCDPCAIDIARDKEN